MDNAQKAIMIGVGLFITIIVIAAVMLITGIGQDLLNSGTQKASSISDNLQAQLTSQYDETTLTGSQVVAAVKSNYKTDGLAVEVVHGSTTYNYGKVKVKVESQNIIGTEVNSKPAPVGPMSTSTDAAYVNPSLSYTAELLKISGSDAVVGIRFTRN